MPYNCASCRWMPLALRAGGEGCGLATHGLGCGRVAKSRKVACPTPTSPNVSNLQIILSAETAHPHQTQSPAADLPGAEPWALPLTSANRPFLLRLQKSRSGFTALALSADHSTDSTAATPRSSISSNTSARAVFAARRILALLASSFINSS